MYECMNVCVCMYVCMCMYVDVNVIERGRGPHQEGGHNEEHVEWVIL